MDKKSLLGAIEREGNELVAAAGGHLEAPCPSCPEWSGADLLRHVGQVHRRFTAAVEMRLTERPRSTEAPPDPQLPDWASERLEHLVDVIGDVRDLPEVWTWTGPRPVSWVVRRMAHETAVHRWDAQAIASTPQPLQTSLAADCTDEYLGVFVPTFAPPYAGPPARLRLEAEDAGAAWMLDIAGDPPAPQPADGESAADAVVRGPASDLALTLWGRAEVGTLHVHGDREVVNGWWSWLSGVRR